MKQSELIEGEIYYYLCNNSPYKYIFTYYKGNHPNNIDMLNHIYINGNEFINFSQNEWLEYNGAKKLRLATPLEKQWLLECIKQNKFIPLEQIKLEQHVEIY